MLVNVSKWGNSLGVRIPLPIARQIGIVEGVPLELTVEDHHLVLQKVVRLEALLAQITPENMHSEVETGPAVGGEIW